MRWSLGLTGACTILLLDWIGLTALSLQVEWLISLDLGSLLDEGWIEGWQTWMIWLEDRRTRQVVRSLDDGTSLRWMFPSTVEGCWKHLTKMLLWENATTHLLLVGWNEHYVDGTRNIHTRLLLPLRSVTLLGLYSFSYLSFPLHPQSRLFFFVHSLTHKCFGHCFFALLSKVFFFFFFFVLKKNN